MLFMNTLCVADLEMLVGGVTSFKDLVIADQMIENTMKNKRIEAEKTKRGTTRKKEVETQAIF